ncbi:MAG TPA: response regulator transcription factor [Kouleothrix sp.]|uniref:response regulator transcription factor n=1 Tax=Kouleothrix sp. TaxID=2779161 RepID=UPI002C20FFA1|nr:response regulator transcription factor [Kouleothrix sp.]
MATILIVEDEHELAALLRRQLEAEGHQVLVAHDGPSGLMLAAQGQPDLIILDWMLPGLDGLAVCRRLRERSIVPILMLTARSEEADRVLGLEVGADDYLVKPFSLRELMARVRAILRRAELLRRAERGAEGPIALGGLQIDPLARRVQVAGEPVDLTVKEYDLLLILARHPGRSFSRAYLLDQVWGEDYDGGDRTVDTHIVRLRRKLGDMGERISTVWGVGYRLE